MSIQRRMAKPVNEMSHYHEYDFLSIVNNDFDAAFSNGGHIYGMRAKHPLCKKNGHLINDNSCIMRELPLSRNYPWINSTNPNTELKMLLEFSGRRRFVRKRWWNRFELVDCGHRKRAHATSNWLGDMKAKCACMNRTLTPNEAL